MISKRNVAAVVAEFLGTAVVAFTFLSISRSSIGLLYFVAIAAGLAITLMGSAFGRDTHFNPALTIALWTTRRIGWMKALAYVLVQILAGYGAYKLFSYLALGQPINGVSTAFDARLMVSEAVGGFILALIATSAAYRFTHPVMRAAARGGAYSLALLVASAAATAQDPFRFVNPSVALASQSWGWLTYVLGPILGAVIGANLYALLFADRTKRATGRVVAATTAKTSKVVEDDMDEDDDDDDEIVSKDATASKPTSLKEKAAAAKAKVAAKKKK